MKKIKLLLLTLLLFTLTGCFNNKEQTNMSITTSVYPIEYVVSQLYKDHSFINSIYPKDTEATKFEVTKILLEDYKTSELFIFNGLSKEKEYVKTLKNNNNNLKIIDVTSNMTIDYEMNELWLDPNNLLTIANNIKEGFNEYIEQSVIKNEISNNYDNLKVNLTSLDGKYYQAAKKATNKTIIVDDNAFKYLEKYGITVISLDDKTVTSKDKIDATSLLTSNTCKYVFIKYKAEPSKAANEVLQNTNATKVELYTMTNLTDIDTTKEDYIALSNQNLENLKKELYK